MRPKLVAEPGRVISRQGLVQIGELDSACFPGDDSIKAADLSHGWWWLLFDDAGQHIAYCGVRKWWGTRAFLTRTGVAKVARGRGLQRRMIKLRERKARSEGLSRMLTYTTTDNWASSNNLIQMGYRLWVPSTGAEAFYLNWYKDL